MWSLIIEYLGTPHVKKILELSLRSLLSLSVAIFLLRLRLREEARINILREMIDKKTFDVVLSEISQHMLHIKANIFFGGEILDSDKAEIKKLLLKTGEVGYDFSPLYSIYISPSLRKAMLSLFYLLIKNEIRIICKINVSKHQWCYNFLVKYYLWKVNREFDRMLMRLLR